MERLQGVYKIVSNEKLSLQFWRMCFDAKRIKKDAKPGHFVHLKVNEGMQPFFRRPFSIYRSKKYVEIFYEVVGPGTQIMSEKKKGDMMDIVGPVGTPFTLPSKDVKQVVMIAGGIGVAPFLALTDALKKRKLELILLYGGRTKGHVYPMKEFKENGVKVFVATDDGSVGVKGRVSKLFDKINCDPKTTAVYTCGPNPMMAAVQKFCNEKNLWAEGACEEVMACALGACLGCSIQTTKGFRTVCYEGPVFPLEEIVFS